MSFKDTLRNAKRKSGKGGSKAKPTDAVKAGGQKKGMGFKAAAENARKNSKGKMSAEEAAAAVAAASRDASPAAKRRNPNLKKVK